MRIVGLVIAASLLSGNTHAVCGHDSRDASEVYAATDAVFYGQVTRLQRSDAEIRVVRSWKGVADQLVAVGTADAFDSGISLDPGRSYLIWAARDRRGHLRVVPCGRTAVVDTARFQADLKWLDNRGDGAPSQNDERLKAYQQADSALANRQFDEAARLFETVLQAPDFVYRREARVGLGLAYRNLGRFRAAVGIYTKELNDSFGTMASWDEMRSRSRRAEAQWGLAVSLLASGEYPRALQAIDDATNKFPAWVTCGNAGWENDYRNALYRGLALERLGRYSEAVGSYLAAALGEFDDPTAALRLADLYESLGRLGDLAQFAARAPDDRGRQLLRVVELRGMEHRREYPALVALLSQRKHTGGMPWESHVRHFEWEAAEAAALLSRHPDETTPLLVEELGNLGDQGFTYYALGLCGTPEATRILSAELINPERAGYQMTLVHALTLAGAPGREALDRLARENTAIARYRDYRFPSRWYLENGVEFPAIPRNLGLPQPEALD